MCFDEVTIRLRANTHTHAYTHTRIELCWAAAVWRKARRRWREGGERGERAQTTLVAAEWAFQWRKEGSWSEVLALI